MKENYPKAYTEVLEILKFIKRLLSFHENGIFDDNNNEIANNIYRKVTIPDENKQNKKKNKDTRFKKKGNFSCRYPVNY